MGRHDTRAPIASARTGLFVRVGGGFGSAIDLHPNDAQAHNNREITSARMGDMQEARTDFQRALELEPEMKEAYENLRKVEAK